MDRTDDKKSKKARKVAIAELRSSYIKAINEMRRYIYAEEAVIEQCKATIRTSERKVDMYRRKLQVVGEQLKSLPHGN